MAREAVIGPEIFQETNKLVAEGKTRTQAFAEIAKTRKARPGTVAANYYRIARQQGQGRKRTATRKRGEATKAGIYSAQRGGRGRTAQVNGDLRQTAQQITELVNKLVAQVEERDRALRQLLG